MRVLWLGLVFVGCIELLHPTDLPCEADQHCPAGLVCSARGRCSGEPTDIPNGGRKDADDTDAALLADALIDVGREDGSPTFDQGGPPLDARRIHDDGVIADAGAPTTDATTSDAASIDVAARYDAAVTYDATLAHDMGQPPDAAPHFDAVVEAPDLSERPDVLPDRALSDAAAWPPLFDRVEIPAGPFLRGEPAGQGLVDDEPQAEIYVSAFRIDRAEITVAHYLACVASGRCAPRNTAGSDCNDADRPDHPANCVSWDQARTFCSAIGGRLPTEAEWEKAARGGCDERGEPECEAAEDAPLQPWPGDGVPGCARARVDGCGRGTSPVGLRSPAGDSVYGVQDVLGNVAEWTRDCYDRSFYDQGVLRDPVYFDPECDEVVVRGGHWGSRAPELTVSRRDSRIPIASPDVGFRCVESAD